MLGDKHLEHVFEKIVAGGPEQEREIILLRCKLEIRTLFLRASLAINTGLIAGLVVQIVRHLGGF